MVDRTSRCNCYQAKKTLKTIQEVIRDTHLISHPSGLQLRGICWGRAENPLPHTPGSHMGWETGLENKSSKKISLPWTSFLVCLSAPELNPTLRASFECRNLWEDNPVHDPSFLQVKGDFNVGGGEPGAESPPASEALSPGCHGPAGCGTGQEDFVTQRSVSVQDMSLKMLYL